MVSAHNFSHFNWSLTPFLQTLAQQKARCVDRLNPQSTAMRWTTPGQSSVVPDAGNGRPQPRGLSPKAYLTSIKSPGFQLLSKAACSGP